MAVIRSTKPPLTAQSIDEFVWKKWFQEIGDLTQSGVVSPSLLSYAGNVQGHYVPKNFVLNGEFSVWQRGISTTITATNSTYSADRWTGGRGGVAGLIMSKQTGPTGFNNCIRATRTIGDANASDLTLCQNLPTYDSKFLAGQTTTLSFWARKGSGFSGDRFEANIRSGTGTDQNRMSAAFTGDTLIETLSIQLSTTWQRYTCTFPVPSTATQIALLFSQRGMTTTASPADNHFDLAGVQYEAGPVASPFQYETFTETLRRCSYYYQKSFDYSVAPAQNLSDLHGACVYQSQRAGANGMMVYVAYVGPLRNGSTITPTFYNYGAANNKWRNFSTGADSGTPALSSQGERGFGIQNPQVAADLAGAFFVIHWSSDAEF